jgi:hypothetical protein
MQTPLIPPEPYSPLPTTGRAYVPVLQDHLGERTALSKASARAWNLMTPLIEVVARGGELTDTSVKGHIRRLHDAVGQHPVYLDLKRIDPTMLVETSRGERPVLELLFAAARKRGLHFMPVAWMNGGEEHIRLVRDAIGTDGQGAALRHRLTGVSYDETIEGLLHRRVEELGSTPEKIDLFLDLEYLDPDSDPSAGWVSGLLGKIDAVGTWRSLVLIGTSVPSSLGNGLVPEHSTKELARREWSLWKDVAEAASLPLAFGDYAVQNPVPPKKPPPIGPWANIRYTLADKLLVARGRDTRTHGTEQYRELSSWISSHHGFRGTAFSYGDSEIARWGSSDHPDVVMVESEVDESGEVDDSTSNTYWRGVGTSHHMEVVAEQVMQG